MCVSSYGGFCFGGEKEKKKKKKKRNKKNLIGPFIGGRLGISIRF